MISFDNALSHVNTAAKQLLHSQGIITKPLAEALSYRLAKPATAQITHPPANMSMMDGYAVKLSDVTSVPKTLIIIGESRAGAPFSRQLGLGEAVRIFTGAVVPSGAQTIVMQENTAHTHSHVTINAPQTQPQNIRRAGLDFTAGSHLIDSGTQIKSKHIAVLAAANIAELQVYKKLNVAILSNGDELKPTGSVLKDGEIINSNGPALYSYLQNWGVDIINIGTSPDNETALKEHIQHMSGADIIVPIGGASVGKYDYVKTAFKAMGYDMIFSKVAMKPGKPVWMAQTNNDTKKQYVLGLPGNPASALVCAHLFLKPLLGTPNISFPAKLTHALRPNGARETFSRGSAHIDEKGQLTAAPFSKQDSGLITPFLIANILLHQRPHSPAQDIGDFVDIIPIDHLMP